VAFTFSGDEDYAKTAMEDALESLQSLPSEKQTTKEIRKRIRDAVRPVLIDYTERKLEPSQKPEFLIAIGTPETEQLFSSRDTAFPRVEEFDCRGTGNYLANYVLGAARFSKAVSVEDAFPIVVRALAAAKRHDDACGGGSQFIVVRRAWATSILNYDLDASDETIGAFERWSALLFSALGDSKIPDADFERRLARFNEGILRLRKLLIAPGSYYRAVADSLRKANPSKSEIDQT
jgi:hypothetical protein